MAKGLKKTKSKKNLRKKVALNVIKSIVKKKYKPVRRGVAAQPRSAMNAVVAAVDATVQAHIPPHIPMGPYTVIKSRVIVPITTSVSSQNLVLLLGAYGRATTFDQSISPAVAILGEGTNVPGVTESYFLDAAVSVYDGTSFSTGFGNGNLHSLSVVVNCTSSATSAAGLIYYGAVNQRVNRGQFATYNALATSLIPRREFSSKSAYSLCTNPHKISAYPVDLTDWSTQKPLVEPSVTLSDNIALDSLSQLALIFPPAGSTAVVYTVTVYTEWRVNFTDPILASTSIRREPAPMSLWNKVIDIGTQVSGSFHALEEFGKGMQSIGSNFGTMSDVAGTLGTLGTLIKPAMMVAKMV